MRANGPRSSLRRLRTWLITGPLGHLYGALADLLAALTRHAATRLRTTRQGPRP